jgi:hypothetical protein
MKIPAIVLKVGDARIVGVPLVGFRKMSNWVGAVPDQRFALLRCDHMIAQLADSSIAVIDGIGREALSAETR